MDAQKLTLTALELAASRWKSSTLVEWFYLINFCRAPKPDRDYYSQRYMGGYDYDAEDKQET